MRRFLFLGFCLFTWGLFSADKPVEFFVVTCSYNNKKDYQKNLETLFQQTYPHWTLCYIDDCSKDGTGELVEKVIQDSGLQDKCRVIHNPVRQGATANFYMAINQYCPSDKVVICYDGDDWLFTERAFQILADIYADKNVWMTYGSHIRTSTGKKGGSCRPFPKEVIKKRAFRQYSWLTDHLRTFYADLFQRIPKKDFLYKGRFLSVCSDNAYIYPILEMASKGHIRFVKEILCVYNVGNPLNDWKTQSKLCRKMGKYIARKPPYKPLQKLSWH